MNTTGTEDTILKRIQQAELYLLVAFDKVCRENGLTYFLDSGTALGAVRHGGFIPWDDDIDVGMPRKDYERFMQIGQSLLPSNIFLQNRDTEANYLRYAAKLRLEGTVFPETNELPYQHNGIFIDIFPFDNIPSNRFLAKLNVKYVVELCHIVRAYRMEGDSESPSRSKQILNRINKKLPKQWINRIEDYVLRYAQRNENKNTGKMTCYFWRMSQTKQYLFDTLRMLPVKDISFDNNTVMIMKDPDYYLKLMYGDYMKLPPEDQRKAHHQREVDFGGFQVNN